MKRTKLLMGLVMSMALAGCSNVTTVSFHEPTPADVADVQQLAHRFMLGETCTLGFNMHLPNYSTQRMMDVYTNQRSPGASTKHQLIYTWGQGEGMPQCGKVVMTIKDPGPEGLQAYDFWKTNMDMLVGYMRQQVRANTSPSGDVNIAALYGARDAAAADIARNATALTVRPRFEFDDPTIKVGRMY